MSETTLAELLERNRRHAESLPESYFDAVEDSQEPAVVSICCADSRVSQEGMWDVREPGWVFTPSTIGNQVWDIQDGERVVDGSVLYPISNTDTGVAVVIGHSGCGALTATLEAVQSETVTTGEDVGKWIKTLVPVVEAGLEQDGIDASRDVSLVNQLVEFNVDRQVAFLRESDSIPESTDVYGFVYDFQGVYGDTRGRAYLVNVNGTTDTRAVREMVPEAHAVAVRRLVDG